MAESKESLYKAHVKNLRSVRLGIDHSYRYLKRSLASEDSSAASALLRVYMLLAGAWAEARLRKLIYEPSGFTIAEIDDILDHGNQLDRWKRAVELGFSKRYSSTFPLTSQKIGRTAFYRLTDIISIINSDLKPLIEMRNKLAHGQWERPLTNNEKGFSTEYTRSLVSENALSAHYKLAIIEHISIVVHELVAGGPAFERDFDYNFGRLETARHQLANHSYPLWQAHLVSKAKKGLRLREQAWTHRSVSSVGRPSAAHSTTPRSITSVLTSLLRR
ncbi:hypothetical protein [Brevundimonas sp.]|uniref:hypothetical protein n=1 Tax=Brevundimonas sp. TaxID=1871086 RepID=UPI0030013B24